MNAGTYTFVIDIPPNFQRDVLARAPAGAADRRRRDRDGAGGPRIRLCATDRRRRDPRLSFPCRRRAVVAGQSRRADRVQPECHDRVVHQRDGHHQQHHDARDHPCRRGDRARARTRHDGSSSGHAADAVRDRDVQGLGERACDHGRRRPFALSSSCAGCSAIPIAGSIPLFMLGVVIYLFFATAIGIFLGTVARSMPQLGLLFMLVFLPMNMLSGSNTPLESMPPWLATIMQASPSTHFVSFAQSILYRGAGFDVVWPEFLAVARSAACSSGSRSCASARHRADDVTLDKRCLAQILAIDKRPGRTRNTGAALRFSANPIRTDRSCKRRKRHL